METTKVGLMLLFVTLDNVDFCFSELAVSLKVEFESAELPRAGASGAGTKTAVSGRR